MVAALHKTLVDTKVQLPAYVERCDEKNKEMAGKFVRVGLSTVVRVIGTYFIRSGTWLKLVRRSKLSVSESVSVELRGN
jgi:hypothetical protein